MLQQRRHLPGRRWRRVNGRGPLHLGPVSGSPDGPLLLVHAPGALRPRAGGPDEPQQAHDLLLHQAEAHGDQGHAGEDVRGARAQRHLLGVLAGEQVAEADGAQGREAEVGALEEAPVLQAVEEDSARADVGQDYYQAEGDGYSYLEKGRK